MITGNVVGGKTDAADLYIEPTILRGCTDASPAMQQEIFGPVLPIVNVGSIAEAVAYINAHEKPLALYVFSRDAATCEAVGVQTTSGAIIANDVLMHAAGASRRVASPRLASWSRLTCLLRACVLTAARAEPALWRRRLLGDGRVPRQAHV
jgi:hypothetical protein